MGRDNTDKKVGELQQLADTLDTTWRVPGTPLRFGLDAIVGLIPGIGDAVTGLVSLWIVIQSWRLGASFGTLLRMLINVGVDVVVGAIPLVGDLLDVFVKTNQSNVQMLREDLTAQGRLAIEHETAREKSPQPQAGGRKDDSTMEA